MGLFGRKKNDPAFAPSSEKTEYENWLNYLSDGGTSAEWDRAKAEKRWSFKEDKADVYQRYLKDVKRVSDKYFQHMQEIQNEWSTLYNLGTYTGSLADRFERKCRGNIDEFMEMRRIDQNYGQKTATNVPAFKRLAMLYEKQGRFEEAVAVCKHAFSVGVDERSRMARMIKKANRPATAEEQKIFDI